MVIEQNKANAFLWPPRQGSHERPHFSLGPWTRSIYVLPYSLQALTMWVHLLDDWDAALQHCASVQAATERESVALTPPLAHQQRDGGDGIPCTTTSSQPTPAPTAPHSGNPLLAIYTALIEVCLNPLEPIALGIIPPKHTAAKPSGEKSDAESMREEYLFYFDKEMIISQNCLCCCGWLLQKCL